MISVALVLLQAAMAQDDIARGARIFAQSCAVGYCHGSGGAANRGPRLAGRSFDRAYLVKVISSGLPGTAMPGFAGQLKADGVNAVTAYVMGLSGGAVTAAPAPIFQPSAEPARFDGPAEARKGKELFFDPVRGPARCGTCHVAEEWGAAIGPNPAKADATAASIRDARAPNVRQASAGADRFPAIVVEQKGDLVRLYDLTGPLPVLRTVRKAEVSLSGGSGWTHSAAIRGYSAADLELIAAYLKWLAR